MLRAERRRISGLVITETEFATNIRISTLAKLGSVAGGLDEHIEQGRGWRA